MVGMFVHQMNVVYLKGFGIKQQYSTNIGLDVRKHRNGLVRNKPRKWVLEGTV